MRLEEQRHWGTTRTLAWDRSALYIFRTTILRARHRAIIHPALWAHAPDTPDVVDLPSYGLSLAWLGDTPHLFPGSLTSASERGQRHKRAMVQAAREAHRREDRGLEMELKALMGFDGQYGSGIGRKE